MATQLFDESSPPRHRPAAAAAAVRVSLVPVTPRHLASIPVPPLSRDAVPLTRAALRGLPSSVSRVHASVARDADHSACVFLRDAGSANGTFIAADLAAIDRVAALADANHHHDDEQVDAARLRPLICKRIAKDVPYLLRHRDVFRLGPDVVFRVVVAVDESVADPLSLDDRAGTGESAAVDKRLDELSSSSPTLQRQERAVKLRLQARGRPFNTARSQDSAVPTQTAPPPPDDDDDDVDNAALPPLPLPLPPDTQSQWASLPRPTQTQNTKTTTADSNRTLKMSDSMPPPPPPLLRAHVRGTPADLNDAERTESVDEELLASGSALARRSIASVPLLSSAPRGPATLDAVDGLLQFDPVGSDDATEGNGEPARPAAANDDDGDDWIETRSQAAAAKPTVPAAVAAMSPLNPRRLSATRDKHKTPLSEGSHHQDALDDDDVTEPSNAPHNQLHAAASTTRRSSPPTSPELQLLPLKPPPPTVQKADPPIKTLTDEPPKTGRAARRKRVPLRFAHSIGEEGSEPAQIDAAEPDATVAVVLTATVDAVDLPTMPLDDGDEEVARPLRRKRSSISDSNALNTAKQRRRVIDSLPTTQDHDVPEPTVLADEPEPAVELPPPPPLERVPSQVEVAADEPKRGRGRAAAEPPPPPLEKLPSQPEAPLEEPPKRGGRGRRAEPQQVEEHATTDVDATVPQSVAEEPAKRTRGRRSAAPTLEVLSPPATLERQPSDATEPAAKRSRAAMAEASLERKESDGTMSQRATNALRHLANDVTASDEPATKRRPAAAAVALAVPLERKPSDGATSRSSRSARASVSTAAAAAAAGGTGPEPEPEAATAAVAATANDASDGDVEPVFVVTACDGVPQSLIDQTRRLGFRFTSQPERDAVTHVVTELGLSRRTEKALFAFALGNVRAVVTPAYLKACKVAGKLLPPQSYALVDGTTERRLGPLQDALDRAAALRARGAGALEGLHFWITPAVEKSITIAERVIKCARGTFHRGLPTHKTPGRVELVIVDPDEKAVNWQACADRAFGIYGWLFVCDAIFSFRVDFGAHWIGGVKPVSAD